MRQLIKSRIYVGSCRTREDYATLNPNSPYIARFDLPKIANLKSMMPEAYREKPLLVSAQ